MKKETQSNPYRNLSTEKISAQKADITQPKVVKTVGSDLRIKAGK